MLKWSSDWESGKNSRNKILKQNWILERCFVKILHRSIFSALKVFRQVWNQFSTLSATIRAGTPVPRGKRARFFVRWTVILYKILWLTLGCWRPSFFHPYSLYDIGLQDRSTIWVTKMRISHIKWSFEWTRFMLISLPIKICYIARAIVQRKLTIEMISILIFVFLTIIDATVRFHVFSMYLINCSQSVPHTTAIDQLKKCYFLEWEKTIRLVYYSIWTIDFSD